MLALFIDMNKMGEEQFVEGIAGYILVILSLQCP